ncbi:hypothetical protein AT15_05060 [Kosmotoga arenicorallina S304]|uniref:Chromate transporter n=1 Tax=Kosmotoga arenicorallina S304 TaxID=1453497 RepID=A0A176JVG8_9BACT|nr:chromate transporter [Kosmotoga arenicorallina]OAA27589.1 hypothetical protein AT15_05060 [Kosmotoga arenicorallina S304]
MDARETGKLFRLFSIFATISAITIGGGYAMIPVIREYLVKRYAIVSDDEFLGAVARAQSVPGAIAVNVSLILGNNIARLPGAIVSLIGVIVPPFFIMILVGVVFSNIVNIPILSSFLQGVRASITAILVYLSYSLILSKLKKMKILVSLFLVTLLVIILKLPLFWTVLVATAIVYIVQGDKK